MLALVKPKYIQFETSPDLLSGTLQKRASAHLCLSPRHEVEAILWLSSPRRGASLEIGLYKLIFHFYDGIPSITVRVEVTPTRIVVTKNRSHSYEKGSNLSLTFLLGAITKDVCKSANALSHLIIRPPAFYPKGDFQITMIRNPFDPDISRFDLGAEIVQLPNTALPQMQDGCSYVVFDGGFTFEIIDRRSLFDLNDLVAENFLPASQQGLSGRNRSPRYTIHDVLLDDDKFNEVYRTRRILSGQPTEKEFDFDDDIEDEDDEQQVGTIRRELLPDLGEEAIMELLGSFHQHREDSMSNLLESFNRDFLIGLGLDVRTALPPVYIPDAPQSMDPLWLDVAQRVQKSGPAVSIAAGTSDPMRAWSSHIEDYPDVP